MLGFHGLQLFLKLLVIVIVVVSTAVVGGGGGIAMCS